MNMNFRLALIRKFGSQVNASEALEIHPVSISMMVNDRRRPRPDELAKLRKAFSRRQLERFFPEPVVQKIEGEVAG